MWIKPIIFGRERNAKGQMQLINVLYYLDHNRKRTQS